MTRCDAASTEKSPKLSPQPSRDAQRPMCDILRVGRQQRAVRIAPPIDRARRDRRLRFPAHRAKRNVTDHVLGAVVRCPSAIQRSTRTGAASVHPDVVHECLGRTAHHNVADIGRAPTLLYISRVDGQRDTALSASQFAPLTTVNPPSPSHVCISPRCNLAEVAAHRGTPLGHRDNAAEVPPTLKSPAKTSAEPPQSPPSS